MSEPHTPTAEQCQAAARFCARTYQGGIDETTRSRAHHGITSLLGLHDRLGSEYFALRYMVGLLAILEDTHQNKTAGKAQPANPAKVLGPALTARDYFAGIAFQSLWDDPDQSAHIHRAAGQQGIPSINVFIERAFDIADTILARAPAPKGSP